MDSILTSIKKLLGIAEDDDSFDMDLILQINSAFSTLTQLGVGPSTGFFIQDAGDVWEDFLPEDPRLSFVKTYIGLKVKIVFDPPSSSAVLSAMIDTAKELEWRIQVAADSMS